MNPIYSVSQINEYLKLRFEEDSFLSGLLIRGEISNYKLYPSGHHYFTLKDGNAALRCVLFKSSAQHLRFRPENGMQVIAAGRISVFPRDGAYQLYCTNMTPDGVGDLHVAFEQLKEKLRQEGLFDLSRKKPLPPYPQRIAIITSPAGAALRDMLRILRARFPLTQVKLLGVLVQGNQAAAQIAGAIAYCNRWNVADLIITGRGGGSIEDLWAFNEEIVARAIAESHIPVISAVGHEPDVTIADFAADLRAATPSNGAELAVPDQAELRKRLALRASQLTSALSRELRHQRQRLEGLTKSGYLQSPMNYLNDRRLLLDYTQGRLSAASAACLKLSREKFIRLTAQLEAMSPLKVLSRGYSLMLRDGKPVKDAGELQTGDEVTVRLSRGSIRAEVQEVLE